MSTEKTLRISSTSSNKTEALAERLGKNLKGGEVIELVSDLGGGKTTFVRGLVRGLESEAHVSSPTFKISNVYKTPKFELHHFDFYRLSEAGIIADELTEVLGDPRIVVIIEWGEVVERVLPADRLTVHIKRTGKDSRELVFSYPAEQAYIMEGLK